METGKNRGLVGALVVVAMILVVPLRADAGVRWIRAGVAGMA